MTETFILQENKDNAINKIKNYLNQQFPRENVEVLRAMTSKPLIRAGHNEITVETLDNGKLEVVVGGPDIDASEIRGIFSGAVPSEVGPSEEDIRAAEESFERHESKTTGVTATASEDVVFKPYGHEEAGYRDQSDEEFDPSHDRCRDCAHFDDHGHCFIVPDIDPGGYCEMFFADFGVFGHAHEDFIEQNLAIFGDEFDWDTESAEEFLDLVADKLSERV